MTGPIDVDALDALPPHLTITVSVHYRNLWRIRLGFAVLRLAGLAAGWIMRTHIKFQPEQGSSNN